MKRVSPTVLLCGLLVGGQAFGITAAEDLDGQLEIRPSSPTASWPESGDSNELAPNYTATISVTVVESEEVGGVNYALSSGPDVSTGGSEEEDISPEEIGLLMLEVEAPTQLTLLESWALQVKALPEQSDIEDIDDLQLEVQRVGQTTWYEFNHGGEPEYTEPARVAGKFVVRVKGSIGDSEHETEPTEEIEVRFPAYADIIGDSGASSKFNELWTTTKNDATDGQRREHGTWVLLNTDSEDYEFDDWPPGGWTANDAWASITPSPKPDDDPLDPTPLDKPTYLAAVFHTHPPATYQTDSAGNQAGLVQVVGPSTQDDSFHNHHKLPEIVYDYTATGTDGLGRPAIPYGHPKDSGAELYPSGSFDRRSLE